MATRPAGRAPGDGRGAGGPGRRAGRNRAGTARPGRASRGVDGAAGQRGAYLPIEPGALPDALATTVDRATRAGLTIDATIDPAVASLDAVRGLAVLRLTQEGLTNVAKHPSIRVIVLTTFDDDDHLFPALAAGACGFLVKDAAPSELLAAIRTAAAGESPFSPAVLRRLVDRAVQSWQLPASASPLPATLTARERDVLALVAAGLSNKEIGHRLHMGVITVKTHVTSLLAKTGAANRIRLALLAVQARL